MSDTDYIALALLAAAVSGTVQYAGWLRFGSRRALEGEYGSRRQALRRWLLFTIAWQVLVLAFVGVYLGVMTRAPHGTAAWIAPVAGAVVGTALPLQVVVMSLLRGLRP